MNTTDRNNMINSKPSAKLEISKLLELRKDRRESREKFFTQGIHLCYNARREKSKLDPEVVLNEFFWDSNREELRYGDRREKKRTYGSIQVLSVLFRYNLEFIISEELTINMIDTFRLVINRIREASNGRPLLSDTSSESDDDLFELKMSNLELCTLENREDCKFEEDLLHEMFISFYYTNRLRKSIPNFQLCYSGIKACSSPNFNGETDISYGMCACDTSQTIDYLVLEKVKGVTLTEMLKKCDFGEYLNWLTQIILSLEMGVVGFGFTHYNLNPDNVIITFPSNEIKIKYWHRNQILILSTSSVAVIKNFETAHVKHRYADSVDALEDTGMIINQNEHFGALGYESLGIYHNETRPFYDIYKLLFWSLRILKDSNPKVYEDARKISKFFGLTYNRNLNKILEDEIKTSYIYSVEITEGEKIRSLSEFFSFIYQIFPDAMGFLSILNGYSRIVTMHCENYCPLNGHSQSVDDKLMINPLLFLGLKGTLERHWGLSKRKQELLRLSDLVCKIKDDDGVSENKLCEPATEELIEAELEFREFQELLDQYASDLYLKGLKILEKERLKVGTIIEAYNQEIDSLRFMELEHKQKRVAEIGERLFRDGDLIRGKIVVLVRDLSIINDFSSEFKVGKQIMNIEVPLIHQFEI